MGGLDGKRGGRNGKGKRSSKVSNGDYAELHVVKGNGQLTFTSKLSQGYNVNNLMVWEFIRMFRHIMFRYGTAAEGMLFLHVEQ